ncbi:hypothetical protein Ntsu_62370 [Nocardia sp. IFM 10818]
MPPGEGGSWPGDIDITGGRRPEAGTHRRISGPPPWGGYGSARLNLTGNPLSSRNS